MREFERDLIRERTQAGLEGARARGRRGGRPAMMTAEKAAVARQLYDTRQQTVAVVSRATIYRRLCNSEARDASLVAAGGDG